MKTKIKIKFDCQNPDAAYGATSVGVSEIPTEAATLALASAWDFILNGNNDNVDLEDCKEILEEFYTPEQLSEVLLDILEGKGEDIFSDHGTSSETQIEILETSTEETGGVLTEYYENEFYD